MFLGIVALTIGDRRRESFPVVAYHTPWVKRVKCCAHSLYVYAKVVPVVKVLIKGAFYSVCIFLQLPLPFFASSYLSLFRLSFFVFVSVDRNSVSGCVCSRDCVTYCASEQRLLAVIKRDFLGGPRGVLRAENTLLCPRKEAALLNIFGFICCNCEPRIMVR